MPACQSGSLTDPSEARVGSGFGYRISRRTGVRTFHAGIDVVGARGTPVFAARPGIVERVTTNEDGARQGFGGYGNAVVVHHPLEDVWSFYAHLDRTLVRLGDEVRPGDVVGLIGTSTNGRFNIGPHLHFEVRARRADGSSPYPGPYRAPHVIDPMEWLGQHGLLIGRGGRWETRPPACLAPVDLPPRPTPGPVIASLPLQGLVPDYGSAYEPVLPSRALDPHWFEDLEGSWWTTAVQLAPVAILTGAGLWAWSRR